MSSPGRRAAPDRPRQIGAQRLAVRRVGGKVGRDLALPPVAVREQALLVVKQLGARLGRKLEVRALDDRVDRAGLLAHAAVDALDHVDVVAGGPPGAVRARLGFDGDRLRRADRLAQLARDAALLAVGIAPERMLAAKARAERSLLVRIVQRHLGLEHVPEGQSEARDQLLPEERTGSAIEKGHWSPLSRADCRSRPESRRSPPPRAARPAGTPSSRAASAGRSGTAAGSRAP